AADLIGVDPVSGDLVLMHQFPGTPVPYRVSRVAGEDEPNSLLLRDLEGDGDLDVVVAYGGADEIGVYRNLGTQFAPLEHRPVGDGPASLRVFEQAPPLYAVAQRGVLSRNVVIYDANWAVRQSLLVHPVADILPLHWDAGGDLDFLLLDQAGVARVFLGSGGNWSAGPSWPTSSETTMALPFAATGGEPAVAVLEGANNRLAVHRDGAPGPAPDPAWYLGGGVRRMAMADTDEDGVGEYFVPLPQDNLILVLRRNGDALRGYRSIRAGVLPSRMRSHAAVGGIPSRLFALCVNDDRLWSYDRVGTELVPLPNLAVQGDARDLRVGSLDGDGLPDAVVLSLTQGVRIFRSDGTGFHPPIDFPIAGDLRDLELAQLDGDGNLDLAVADFAVRGIRIFHGDGAGGFT
ncbi:MAG TPA: VCBS repeat-containing protein, partial [Pseudomonadales bacterium]|nr:VCBS repeat-containing protein [Pseudomonadales bacterium]